MLVFVQGGKPENPEKNSRKKAKANFKLNHMWHLWPESKQRHIGGKQALSPMRQLDLFQSFSLYIEDLLENKVESPLQKYSIAINRPFSKMAAEI